MNTCRAVLILVFTTVVITSAAPAGSTEALISTTEPTVGETDVVVTRATEPTRRATGPMVVSSGYDGDDERAEWVFEQFDSVGLTLTDIEVRFSSDAADCSGNRGLHTREDGTSVVAVCGSPQVGRRRTLLHETSHAWVAQHVDEQVRAEFMELRGVTVWNDHDVEWHDRGTEHAAEIVVWGIGDQPCWHLPAPAIGDRSQEALAEAFQLLTGMAPRCDADTPEPPPATAAQFLE